MKKCPKCRTEKPPEDFYFDSLGRCSYCKSCNKAVSGKWRKEHAEEAKACAKKWAAKNPESGKKAHQRWYKKNQEKLVFVRRERRLRKRYGMSEKDYQALLEKQSGVCAICKTVPDKQRLYVDHCHTEGRVRGLLCHFCNVGIGNLKDSPALLIEAAKYLQK